MEYSQQLQALQERGGLRRFRPLSHGAPGRVVYRDTEMLNLTSNDYLGLAGDAALHQEFYQGMEQGNVLNSYGLGAASSRLLTGDTPMAHTLEEKLKNLYSRSGCLLFNSGYHANIGILPALAGKRDLILSDKLNHASIHDGLRLSRADYKRYRHRDYEHLAELLESQRRRYDRVFIVTESVFSMDGDEADLETLVALKKQHDCQLYVDEAHGVGVYGSLGLGKAEEAGVIGDVDLLVGTFGKAFASVGAYVICEKEIVDYLVNFSRSLIFTTGLPPVTTHWNLFILGKVQKMTQKRQALAALGEKLRYHLQDQGLQTAGSTNIVPVIIGDNQKTVDLAEQMQNRGFLIFAIRPPTVPEGTSRFRLSLTADMCWEDIQSLPTLISNSREK